MLLGSALGALRYVRCGLRVTVLISPRHHFLRFFLTCTAGLRLCFFFCMALVAWFCPNDTLRLLPPAQSEVKAAYSRRYKGIAIAMVSFPLAAFLLTSFLGRETYFIFAAEAFGVFTFAIYWLVKSREMALLDMETEVMNNAMPPKDMSAAA